MNELPQYPWQARQGATLILDGFADYNRRFRAITARAQARFERREWIAQQRDLVERIELYDISVAETSQRLIETLGRGNRRWTIRAYLPPIGEE